MLPIHLSLFGNEIYFYEGLYFLISIALGVYVAYLTVKRNGGNTDHFDGLITWSIIGALIGARLSHYLFWNLDVFMQDPTVIFSMSGNSITGGLVGGMVGGLLFTRRKRLNYFEYFAMISPGLLLGQAVGRMGCFLNGDAHGIATNSAFGVQFPRYGTMIPGFETNYNVSSSAWHWSYENGLVDQASLLSAPLHPTQLYEMFGDFVLMFLVFWVLKTLWQSDRKSPLIFFIHTGGYSFLRFMLEFIRGDREFVAFANMTNLQLALLGYSIFTLVYAIRYYAKKKANG